MDCSFEVVLQRLLIVLKKHLKLPLRVPSDMRMLDEVATWMTEAGKHGLIWVIDGLERMNCKNLGLFCLCMRVLCICFYRFVCRFGSKVVEKLGWAYTCMYICGCIYIHIYIHIYTYTYIYIYISYTLSYSYIEFFYAYIDHFALTCYSFTHILIYLLLYFFNFLWLWSIDSFTLILINVLSYVDSFTLMFL
jgi:hypothetical protein